jgi:hypothetical protein
MMGSGDISATLEPKLTSTLPVLIIHSMKKSPASGWEVRRLDRCPGGFGVE